MDNSVQHAQVWRKSARSSGTGNDCVELADLRGAIGVRDSKNPAGGHLSVSPEHLAALFAAVKGGAFDL